MKSGCLLTDRVFAKTLQARPPRRLKDAKKGAIKAGESHRHAANNAYSERMPIIQEKKDAGLSLRAIADHLNEIGHTTQNGKLWNASQVMRVGRRIR
jgi:hypothetical protein